MTNTLKSLIGNSKAHLKIAERIFSDESISDKTLNSCAFIKLTFHNCTFHKVDFSGSSFAKCDFNECTFSETIFKRVEFESCSFQNCKIIDSNLDKVDFDETSLNYCQFKKISLLAGYFQSLGFNTYQKQLDSNQSRQDINENNYSSLITQSLVNMFLHVEMRIMMFTVNRQILLLNSQII